jgi:riboflavin kinase/FMN adenylyltransferase
MQVWKSLAEVPESLGQTAVTVGKFDGVHLGHRALLRGATMAAKIAGYSSVCLTFDKHPDALLAPERVRPALTGETQKLDLLAEAGIDATLQLPFDEHLAGLTPREFVEQVLVEKLHAKHVVVGDDFRFGARGSGDVRALAEFGIEFGFAVEVVAPVLVHGRRVSTSLVRDLLDEGDVVQAAQLLGRLHSTRGVVEHGLKLGRQLGFPTANLSRDSEGFLPLDGVYAGWLHSDGERYPAALSVGINETIQAVPRLLEAHVLDRKDLNLYDKVVNVEYVQFLRPAAKFDGIDALIAAIHADCDQIRNILR